MSEGDALETPADGEAVMPDFRGMSMRRVLQVMEKRNINIRLLGSGRAMEQSPPPGQQDQGRRRGLDKIRPVSITQQSVSSLSAVCHVSGAGDSMKLSQLLEAS